MSAPIDYDRLVADYDRGLIDRLRGFEAGQAEFLELWVPDEDPASSLRNLLDAAAEAGESEVDVGLGAETAERIDRRQLDAMASEFGSATLEANGAGLRLRVTGLHRPHHGAPTTGRPRAPEPRRSAAPAASPARADATPAGAIGDVYRAGVDAALAALDHEGERSTEAGLVRVEAASDAARLVLDVEPATHVVRRARHVGADDRVARALLDRLCALIEDTTIQDASDHGVIRLEFALRGRGGARPVAGIVTPASADAAFRRPEALIRGALADYREKTGYSSIENDFDAGVSDAWRALSDADRRDRLADAMSGIADVEVVAIEHDVRVVVRFVAPLSAEAKQRAMMDLEAAIKQKLDRRLELHQEELTDANVIRRLSDAGEPR